MNNNVGIESQLNELLVHLVSLVKECGKDDVVLIESYLESLNKLINNGAMVKRNSSDSKMTLEEKYAKLERFKNIYEREEREFKEHLLLKTVLGILFGLLFLSGLIFLLQLFGSKEFASWNIFIMATICVVLILFVVCAVFECRKGYVFWKKHTERIEELKGSVYQRYLRLLDKEMF